MPAEILEVTEGTEVTDDLPTNDGVLTTDELVQEFSQPDTTVEPEPEVPEKYRGKSITQVVAMHQEAEKLIGSQGSEVGELRKVVDDYISAQTAIQSQPQPEPEPVDFFEDPEKAVNQAIEHHPEVVRARETSAHMQQSAALTQLQGKHPDMKDVLNNPQFATWVKGSPIRSELFARADRNYDFNAADELISTFKERAQAVQTTVQTETAARQQAVKAAATGGGSGANTAGSKRVYRRADIIKLMKNDPDRYEALSPEIMQAYAEGRVR